MTGYRFFLARDLTILTLTILLWALLPAGDAGQIATGGLTGLCALLFHEHGHVFGARKAGAHVQFAPKWSPFIFNLNPIENTRAQLLSTSLWGFAATGFFVILFLLVLPTDTLAGVVGLSIGLLLASLTVFIEFPIAWRMSRGYAVPDLSIFKSQGNGGDD